jgi:autotransporter-associated beta strand protein
MRGTFRSLAAFWLGTSALAGIDFASSPALANCTLTSGTGTANTPDPNSSVSCSGSTSQSGGVVIGNGPANNISVTLQPNAVVAATAAPPITLGNAATVLVGSQAVLSANSFSGQQALAAGIGANVTITGTTLGIVDLGSGATVTVQGTAQNNFASQPAIRMGTDNNRLILFQGYGIVGDVIGGNAGATQTVLELGGTGSITFDVSAIGPSAQYQNFAQFQKTGASTWTLLSTTAQATPWSVSGGTLSIADDASLGASSGLLTLNGGTLLATASTSGSRSIGLGTAGGTINVAGGATLTEGGPISGGGGLTKTGAGTLVLTANESYSGGTTVSGSTLQVGAGGTTGSLGPGTIVINNNGVLVFNRSDTVTVSNVIMTAVPNGALTQAGSGTLILTGDNTYNGGTTIAAGTLQVGNGGASGALGSGGVVNNGVLVFNRSDTFTAINSISGSGSLTQAGTGTLLLNSANSYSGTTTINSGGTLQVGPGGTNGTLGSGNVVDNGVLNFNHTDNVSLSNIVSGSGGLGQIGTGTLTLTGANTYTGGTTVNAGTLQLGAGGSLASTGALAVNGGTFDLNGHTQTVGSLSGTGGAITLGSGSLTVNSAANASLFSVIAGSGSLVKMGTGTLTLSAANTYTGGTTVNAGTLNVTGAIASSSASVANGATLTGTGKVGATSVASGGTLGPGSNAAPGILSVAGNLTLASGSNYTDSVTPTTAGLTSVSGTASVNGNAMASFVSGGYVSGQHYTLITATGGVSGTFAALNTPGLPFNLKGQLSYDSNNVYLNLTPNSLAPLLSNATGNQQKLVSAIDAAVLAGNVPPPGFSGLYSLSGPALNTALDQISGQAAPNVINAVGQGFLSFMSMTAGGGSGDAASFAPDSAYGGADAPHRAQLGSGQTRVWGAAYGGHVGLSGDSASGAASLSSNNVGMIGGADMQVSDGVLVGATLGLGRQLFHSGNGSGDSSDFLIGLYGRADAGAAYFAASFGYGWHEIKTLRVVTVSGTDVLQGKQNADDFGGRIEAGWRLPLDDTYTAIPYGAFAGESFESPAYAEMAISGAPTFALSYAAQTTTLGRSELGARLDRNYALEQGTLTADVRAAWAHQLDDLPFTQASFLNLPGASFQVVGVRPGRDTALLGLDLEVRNTSGLFFGVRGEGQFGTGTTVVEGLGNFGWRW